MSPSDDEGSIVRELVKGQSSCGACRTRESEAWWRAPKGLPTDILCDACGTNWRKYADLSVRPLREDTLLPGKKVAEKREGTPMNGPSVKRLKVGSVLCLEAWLVFIFTQTSAVTNGIVSPPNASTGPQLRCHACQKVGTLGKIVKCQKCSLRIHAGMWIVQDQNIILTTFPVPRDLGRLC